MYFEPLIGFDTLSYYHPLTHKQKKNILEQLRNLSEFRTIRNDYFNESYEYTSNCFASNGVKIYIFRVKGSKWGLLIVIHPTLVLGNKDRSALYLFTKPSYSKMVKLVDKMLSNVKVPCSLDDMKLYRADVTANLIFSTCGLVDEYLRILRKGFILPHYRLDWFREKDGKAKDCKSANRHSYKQKCKSAAFFAYDKTAQLKMIDQFPAVLIGKKILRLEMQLRRKALKKWVSGKKFGSNKDILKDVYMNRKSILKWYLNRIQPTGEIVRYKDAVELINRSNMKAKTRDRMLYLLRKTSDSENLSAALKKMQEKYRLTNSQCNTILKRFQKLGISPITLRNNSDFEEFPPIWKLSDKILLNK